MSNPSDNVFHFSFTKQQLAITVIGNLLIGIGIAILRVSAMGNDAYSAMTMSLSQITPLELGAFQILLNAVFVVIQLIWGKKYVGIGTVFNMFLLGYVVQYTIPVIMALIGQEGSHPLPIKLIIMMVGVFVISLGISVYQKANAGVAPFDYLSLAMTDVLPTPYFVNRMLSDTFCLTMALFPLMIGAASFGDCHIGLGTAICVCCFGPFVSMCDRYIVNPIAAMLQKNTAKTTEA